MASTTSFAQCPKPQREWFYFPAKQPVLIDGKIEFIKEEYDFIKEIMDENSFQKITRTYYKDKNHVYFKYIRDICSSRPCLVETFHLIEDADPQTFKVLKYSEFEIWKESELYPYSYDKSRVYYDGFPIENANPKTFKPLNSIYSTDGERVFYKNCEIESVDLQTFKVSGDGYYSFAYDKHFLYFHYQKEKIDIETFEVFADRGSRCSDKRYVFYLIGTSFDGHIEKKRKLFIFRNKNR